MIEQVEGKLHVTAPMTIANGRSLLEAGRSFLLASTVPVIVDLAAVREVDSSSLSVVLAWLRTARERRLALHLINPPESLITLATLYGVSGLLPLA